MKTRNKKRYEETLGRVHMSKDRLLSRFNAYPSLNVH